RGPWVPRDLRRPAPPRNLFESTEEEERARPGAQKESHRAAQRWLITGRSTQKSAPSANRTARPSPPQSVRPTFAPITPLPDSTKIAVASLPSCQAGLPKSRKFQRQRSCLGGRNFRKIRQSISASRLRKS